MTLSLFTQEPEILHQSRSMFVTINRPMAMWIPYGQTLLSDTGLPEVQPESIHKSPSGMFCAFMVISHYCFLIKCFYLQK